ncbi:sigma-70 family RNA polymerase sigma factor [Kordiimonas aquimaris]|uniref:sigma-70 family RNA polymerase sigma factor n=1 Tax=Kordiimonas aquimaris TaxID=707591 RepID=UPI0021CED94C|nr:sigma-70 family RNA polymerase sigma factor [Kordiimonas aquimaris]
MYAEHQTIETPHYNALTQTSRQCLSSQRAFHDQLNVKGRHIIAVPSETLEMLAAQVAKERSKQAFKKLFDHFAPRIKSFILKQKISDEAAEDLTQEVMVTVWHKAHMFDPKKAKLSTWIFRIARNKFIDQVRKQKYVEVNVDDHIQFVEADEKTDTPVIQGQDKKRITKAMSQLKDNLRTVIELSFYQDMSHSQIAEHLDLPLGTVKSRIRIAFQKLRAELGDY